LKLVVGVTGASGTKLALKFLKFLPDYVEVFCVFSKSAKVALALEEKDKIEKLEHVTFFEDSNIGAAIASGSFQTDAMIILPCSMNTLAKCAVGISDTLITRTFHVMLKEQRKIVLAPREMPFSPIALENMTKLSTLGVVMSPPMLGYYSEQQTLEDMEKFIIGKWYDSLKIEHNLYKRWE
jgi:4-hydroxy-3-polyprenylbenzoate decarboxylase